MSARKDGKWSGRHGRLVEGIILIGVGLIFLLSNLDIIPGIGEVWPLFLIVVGFALFAGAFDRRSSGTCASSPGEPDPTQPPPSPQ